MRQYETDIFLLKESENTIRVNRAPPALEALWPDKQDKRNQEATA